MTHKERARLFYSVNDEGQPIDMVGILGVNIARRAFTRLAAAFAEVEREAKEDERVRLDAIISQIRSCEKCNPFLTLPKMEPFKRVDSIRIDYPALDYSISAIQKLIEAENHAFASVVIPRATAKSCTCGAAATRTLPHSSWCDAA